MTAPEAAAEAAAMRIGYFGPEGTFTHDALIAGLREAAGAPATEPAPRATTEPAPRASTELVPLPTIYETVMAVQTGEVDRALVPIENSLEGSVNVTLDTLAIEARDVAIVGERVHRIRHCLVTRTELQLSQIEVVVSHAQANAQCAGFIRTQLPGAQILAASSTADAVRMVAGHDGPWAALGTRLAAERHGCRVLREGVEDGSENETRFVWLARRDETVTHRPPGPWKTSIVFWGSGSDAPGWLVRSLSEFADRGVNLTRIESRPLKQGLGSYMFFLDLQGRDTQPEVSDALGALRHHVEVLRVLGSYSAASAPL